MLELEFKDLAIYKDNLVKNKRTFFIQQKRNEINIVVGGKAICKIKKNNSLTFLAKDKSKEILTLFSVVKKSINKFLVENNFYVDKEPKKYDSTFSNRLLFDSLPIGTKFYYADVKHCYWRIAYLKGYISEYFYKKVLDNPELKLFRNMALSCIIAPKSMDYYINGILIHSIIEDTTIYNDVYESIRFKAWNIFGSLCFEKIGQEKTIGYYTDGIMCFNEDLPFVKTMLARNQLQYKIVPMIKIDYRKYINTETNEIRKF